MSFQAGHQPFHAKGSFLGDRAERQKRQKITRADYKKLIDQKTLSSRPLMKAHVFQTFKILVH